MSNLVLVTGASGFIGRSVVSALLQRGYRVRAFVRATAEPFDHHPNLSHAVGDMRDLKSLEAAMAGVTYVIHLGAAKSDEKDSEAINIGGAKNLIEACRIVGVKRIVNVSTQSAKLIRPGRYGSTKAEADRLLHASPIPVVTLRCSLIYATELSGVFGTIVKFSSLPFIPMFGDGEVAYRPMHRDDLAHVILSALEKPDITGTMIDVGGPDSLTFNTLTQAIMNARGIRRPIIHFPVWLGLVAAKVLSVLPHPPITVSNVLGGAENVPMDMKAFNAAFAEVRVRPFNEGLAELFGPAPQPDDHEAKALLAYVLSSVGRWEPDNARVDLLKKALAAHGLHTSVLDRRVTRSRSALGRYDAASRLLCPHSLLQSKLLVAAAVAEVQTESAAVLLPQDRSLFRTILWTLDLCACGLWKMLCALPLLVTPGRLKHYAGSL